MNWRKKTMSQTIRARITGYELKKVWDLKAQLEREKRRLQDLRVIAESTTAILDDMPHAKPQTFKTERITLLIVACQEKIETLTEQLIQAKTDLLCNLQSLNLNEMCERVLSYRYVACLTYGTTARLMNVTRDYVWKLHKRGLKLLGLTFDDIRDEKLATTVDGCPS